MKGLKQMKRTAVLLILGLGVALADSAPASGAVDERATDRSQQSLVTNSQVEQWLRTWQARLALTDWKVDAHIVRAADLNPDTLGHLKWNASDHTASIKVLSPLDYDLPADQIPADMERTVVHELVHLQLSVLPRNGSKITEEQVVNKITEALLQLDHGGEYEARVAAHPTGQRSRYGNGAASRSK
jgi:hypothetical protein